MTKRDYELIARIIRDAPIAPANRNLMALALCRGLKADNPNFRPDLFVKACGASHGVLLAVV